MTINSIAQPNKVNYRGAVPEGQTGATGVRLPDPDLNQQGTAPLFAGQGVKVSNNYLEQETSKFEAGGRKSQARLDYEMVLRTLAKTDIGEKVRCCEAGELAAVMRCSDCGRVVYSPVGCCNDALCPECRAFYGKRKAVEATRRLEDWGLGQLTDSEDKRWGFPRFEFTIPADRRDYFRDKKAVRRWLKLCREVLAKWYGLRVGGVETVHTWASKSFWDWSPHIHILIAGLGWSDDKGFVRLRLKRHNWELRNLRWLYTRAMMAEFGWSRDSVPLDSERRRLLVVHYGWCGGVESLAFRLGYMFRSPSPRRHFQGWQALEGLSRVQILGVARHFYWLKGFRRILWFGFFGNRLGKWLASKLGVKWRVWKDKLDYWRCPFCGGRLVMEGFKFIGCSAGRSPPPGLGVRV